MDSESSAAQQREARSHSIVRICVNFFKMKKDKYLDTDIDCYLTSDD